MSSSIDFEAGDHAGGGGGGPSSSRRNNGQSSSNCNNTNIGSRRRGNMSPNETATDLSFCILWSPLWPITCFLPFIGHTGIADSHGIANDFQGSYYVGTDGRMAFGPPTRYLKIDIDVLPGGATRWDEAIREANQVYSQRIHNICCDNCHSHVANALNRMPLEAYGVSKWDMVKLATLIFFKGQFVSFGSFVCTFLPFVIFILVIVLPIVL